MEYPYTDQPKVKSEIRKGDFILFREKDAAGNLGAVTSGTVSFRRQNKIHVEVKDEGQQSECIKLDLDDLILYRDTEWEDGYGYTVQADCQEGVCPLCGGELEYGERDDIDDGGTHQWECKECGSTGEEGFDRVFDGNHYNVQDANGVPVEIAGPASPAATKEMTCTYLEYQELIDKLYLGVGLTDSHLNNATETIRMYLVDGGAGEIMQMLGIGIKTVARKSVLLDEDVIYIRFIWLKGSKKGEELAIHEIRNIGMFLKCGPFYGRKLRD